MVPAVVLGPVSLPVLAHGRSPKLPAPYDEGFLQQTSLVQILDQCRCRAIDSLGTFWQVIADVRPPSCPVVVPSPVVQLDEPNPVLDQTAGQQAVVGKRRLAGLCAVHRVDGVRLSGDVHDLGDGDLHAEGELVLLDPRQRVRQAAALVVHPVHVR